jgi:Ion transport protein
MVESGSNFHKFWGIVIIFLLLYTATLMPYKIALIEDDVKDPLYYIDTVVDFIFMLDILINFNMPIE